MRSRLRFQTRRLITTLGLGLLLAGGPGFIGSVGAKEAPGLRAEPAKATKIRSQTTTPAAVQQRPTRTESDAKPLAEAEADPAAQPQQPGQTRTKTLLPSGKAPIFGIDAPDLVPEGPGGTYCDWMIQDTTAVRTVHVRVKNVGSKFAPPTDVWIKFDGGAFGTSHPIGGQIYAGGFKSVEVGIPETCFGSNGICGFQIEVDHANLVSPEQNEYNNNASGSCPQE